MLGNNTHIQGERKEMCGRNNGKEDGWQGLGKKNENLNISFWFLRGPHPASHSVLLPNNSCPCFQDAQASTILRSLLKTCHVRSSYNPSLLSFLPTTWKEWSTFATSTIFTAVYYSSPCNLLSFYRNCFLLGHLQLPNHSLFSVLLHVGKE